MVVRHVVRSGLAAVVLLGLTASGALAQDASPAASPAAGPSGPPPPAGCEVVASGLVTPRFVALGDDGTVYVTESGTGGDESFVDPLAAPAEAEEASPVPQITEGTPLAEAEADAAPLQTRGYTGQVSAIAPDGATSVLADGFASYSGGVGPGGITLGPDGALYMVVGGSAILAGLEPLDGENTVFRIDPATGESTSVAELGQYEVDNNPDGTDVNPNLYNVVVGADGMLYVTDAGGNTIYRVDPATGDFSLFAIVPGLEPGEGTPVDPADPSGGVRQPVPTGLTVDADGVLHVVLLSEFWPADAASVYAVADDGTFTGVANGLFFSVAITTGPDGSAYVTELFAGPAGLESGQGAVLRVGADGSTEVVLDGLALPHGTAFDADGNLYVVTGSVFTGPDGPPGQVLRCAGVAGGASATPTA